MHVRDRNGIDAVIVSHRLVSRFRCELVLHLHDCICIVYGSCAPCRFWPRVGAASICAI